MAGWAVVNGVADSRRLDSGASVVDRAYDYLRDQLVSGGVVPGARVNLGDVCRDLHVSNTPVRRALERLAAEGYVSRLLNRGYFASPLLDTRAINELYDFRLLVEPTSAGRAARKASGQQVEELASAVSSRGQTEVQDHHVHLTIAQLAGNRLLAQQLATTFDSFSHLTRCGASESDEAREEHHAIVAAIAAADADLAAQSMRAHLTGSRDRLRSLFGR